MTKACPLTENIVEFAKLQRAELTRSKHHPTLAEAKELQKIKRGKLVVKCPFCGVLKKGTAISNHKIRSHPKNKR